MLGRSAIAWPMLTAALVVVATRAPVAPAVERIWSAASVATLRVPDVLLSGNHGEIRRWRKREALKRTLLRRPDLLPMARLDAEEQDILDELEGDRSRPNGRRAESTEGSKRVQNTAKD